MLTTILILMAVYVPMPEWLSVLTIVFAVLRLFAAIIIDLIKIGLD